MSLSLVSCKKNDIKSPGELPTTAGQLKLPHGAVTGNAITKEIGPGGGTFQSADGIMKITVPAGAVDGPVTFSVQPVENTLGNKALSYRLKPADVAFKKPVALTYQYTSIELGNIDPKYFFLACQDEEGYYYSAKKTRGNKSNRTLTVETTHFSDWTFYALYEFHVSEGNVVDGKIQLGEDESAELYITRQIPKNTDGELDPLLVPLTDPVISSAGWDFITKKGTLTVMQTEGKAIYRAPQVINTEEEIVVTAMMNGELGKDNEGNPIRQMQLSQPIVLKTGDYFILEENGVEMIANNVSAELTQLVGVQMNATFTNGTNLACYIYATVPGGYSYNEHGVPGKAVLELVPGDGMGYIVFRPEYCDGGGELIFSPGSFVLTSVANSIGEYFEGNFTATLYQFNICDGGKTKTISGKFRFRRKL